MAAKKTILFDLVLRRIDNKSKEGTKFIKKGIIFASHSIMRREFQEAEFLQPGAEGCRSVGRNISFRETGAGRSARQIFSSCRINPFVLRDRFPGWFHISDNRHDEYLKQIIYLK